MTVSQDVSELESQNSRFLVRVLETVVCVLDQRDCETVDKVVAKAREDQAVNKGDVGDG